MMEEEKYDIAKETPEVKIEHANGEQEQNHHSHHHHSHGHGHGHHHKRHQTKTERIKSFLEKHNIFIMICAAVLLLGAIVLFAHLDSSKANKKPADQQPTLSDSETAGSSDANPGIESDINNDPASERPLYSFGVLSDLHLQYGQDDYGGVADFQRALTYLQDRVSFTCISGDLVAWAGYGDVEYFGTINYMEQYKKCIEQYAGSMPVYECAGNHETYPQQGVSGTIDVDLWRETTGKELYYSFSQGDDVFIFLSLKSTNKNDLFADGGLNWLEETLETNKNKRCFVFQHCPALSDKSADPSGTWSSLMDGTSGKEFVSLMKKYKNAVWFHGHTHVTLNIDEYPVSDVLGYKSVHVPSLVSPRFYDESENMLQDYYFDEDGNKVWGSLFSEGYIVDVYENKIVIKGVNFAAGSNRDCVEEMYDETYVLNTVIRIMK